MEKYQSIYWCGENLRLPRRISTYFDLESKEWGELTLRQKLLDLGYVTSMGLDIPQLLRGMPNAKASMAELIAGLEGVSAREAEACCAHMSAKETASVLQDKLRTRYILPYDGPGIILSPRGAHRAMKMSARQIIGI